jgi:hypothetical protein
VLGGVLSLTALALVITTIVFLAKDFYTKSNPRSYQEVVDVIDEPEPFQVTTEDLPICWRFYLNDSIRVNETEKLFMNVTFTDWLSNKETRQVSTLRVNETSLYNKTDYTWSVNWWCLNLDYNYTFGGGLVSKAIDWYTFQVSNCPVDKNVPCTSISDVKEYLRTTQVQVEFLYPSYNYNPKSPQHIQWIRYKAPISLGLNQFDTYWMRNVSVFDDQGWAGAEVNETKYLSVATRDVSFTYQPYDGLKDNDPYVFYKSETYIDRINQKYYRSFMKVQDVLSQVGGIINIIMIVFKIASLHYNSYRRNEFIINEIFEHTNNYRSGVGLNK